MQPYRNDVEALAARHAALEAEVADKTRARDEAARMLAEAQARERADAIAADRLTGGPARRRNAAVAAAIGAVVLGVIGFAVIRGGTNQRERRMAMVLAQFAAFTDQICACRDKACAEKVSEQMTKWGTEVARTMPQDDKPDEATMKKAQALGERMSTCMMKAYEVDAVLEAPDPNAPAADEGTGTSPGGALAQ